MTISQETLTKLGISFVQESHGISEFKLDVNGLKILLMENHAAPVVTTMVVYKVGSRNEGVGHTGSTHFLEHMMFKSTPRFNHAEGRGIDDLLKPIGANYNATTSNDRTNYYECVPRQHLGLCLELEADRMRNLRLKESDRASEMTVVRNEFENGENSPEEALDKVLMGMAFREHPYHHPVIGWRADVEGVPLEKLQSFYDVFYWPNNATLIIVGDFQPQDALALVNDTFGKIPASPHKIPALYTVESKQEGLRRFEVRRAGNELPRVVMGFHMPAASHRDYHALCVLKDILGDSDRASSRLFQSLFESELVTQVYAQQAENRDPGLFRLGATVAPESTPEKVEAALLAQIAKLAKEGVPEAELSRVKLANRNSTATIKDDPIAYADQLCESEAVADWTFLVQYDDKYDAVSADDVKRVANEYFTRENMTVGCFLPESDGSHSEEAHEDSHDGESQTAVTGDKAHADGETHEGDDDDAAENQPQGETAADAVVSVEDESADRSAAAAHTEHSPTVPVLNDVVSLLPESGMDFASKVVKHVLPNGLTLLVMPSPGTGVVSVAGSIRAGSYFNSPKKTMLADITASMLMTGSHHFNKIALGEALESMGTSLDFSADNFAVTFDSTMVKPSLTSFTALLADVLMTPSLTDEEFKKAKKDYAADLKESSSDPAKVARVRLAKALYKSDHVYYHKSFSGLVKELRTIELGDVLAFYAAHYSPKSTILCVVGDVTGDEVLDIVTRNFGGWTGAEAKEIVMPEVKAPKASRRIDVPMADKASVSILIGLPVPVKRTASDYLAARLANSALGQDTMNSRLGAVVREEHGLTYGIYSTFEDIAYGQAPWQIELTVNPANVEKALQLVNEVVEKYRKEGISERELVDEAGRTYGAFVVNLRTTHAIASTLAWLASIGLDASVLDRLHTELKAVTQEAVNKSIREYLRLDKAVTVLVGTLPGAGQAGQSGAATSTLPGDSGKAARRPKRFSMKHRR